MPALNFATGVSGRPSAQIPTIRATNIYTEPTPGGPKEAVRIGAPGLTRTLSLGSGPVQRMTQDAGLFLGDLFTVSAGGLYRNGNLISAIPFGQNPRMDATNTQLGVVSGGALYAYDGTTLTLIEFFDDGVSRLPPFSGIIVLYNIWLLPVAGTNQFFFSKAGDLTSINAANFSQAQTSPGPIVEMSVLAEEVYISKTDATEIWDFVGTLTAPFTESLGRTYIRGAASQNSVVTKLDNALFWVGDDLFVYRSGAVPEKVSIPFVDDILHSNAAFADQFTAFKLGVQGHWFYILNVPTEGESGMSLVYDCANKEWYVWGSQVEFQSDPGLYPGQCSGGQGDTIWIGSGGDGRVWLVDTDNQTYDGAARQVVCAAAIWVTGGTQRLNNVSLACARGVGAPNAPQPNARARFSYDGNRTWTSWIDGQISPIGAYNYKANWRGLGLIQQPGVGLEFQVLDPVLTAIEGGSYNEARI